MKEHGTLKLDKCEILDTQWQPHKRIWIDGYVFESMEGKIPFPFLHLFEVLNILFEKNWKLKTAFENHLIFEKE